MRAILWTISLILIVIDVFDIGAKMEKALVDTADHIDARKDAWTRATVDEHGKETPYSDRWGRLSITLVMVGAGLLIALGVALNLTELPIAVVNAVGALMFAIAGAGFLLFICLSVLTMMPQALGVFAFAIKWLARQKRGVIGSVGLGIGIIGLFF